MALSVPWIGAHMRSDEVGLMRPCKQVVQQLCSTVADGGASPRLGTLLQKKTKGALAAAEWLVDHTDSSGDGE